MIVKPDLPHSISGFVVSRPVRQNCAHCSVRDVAPCRGLSDEGLAEVDRVSYRKRIAAGGVIVREGDPASWCGMIVSGVVKLGKTSPDGRQQIVGLQFASEFFGQPFNETWKLSAEAATPVDLCCFSQPALETLRNKYPAFGGALLQDTVSALNAAREWMFVLGRKTAEEKLASFLLLVAERSSGDACTHDACTAQPKELLTCDLALSRTEISEYLGLRLETVSRQFKKLKSAGVIETTGSRSITFRDLAQLKRLADSEGA
jgi:CRP/FNR family transcriptional regulator, anaerobic regulatory protein